MASRPSIIQLRDNNIVKIAVQMVSRPTQFIEFNQKQPLSAIIQDLCNLWGLPTDQAESQYSLRVNNKPSQGVFVIFIL